MLFKTLVTLAGFLWQILIRNISNLSKLDVRLSTLCLMICMHMIYKFKIEFEQANPVVDSSSNQVCMQVLKDL